MERRLRKEKHRLRAFTKGMYYFREGDTADRAIHYAKIEYKWDNRSWTENELLTLEKDLIESIYVEMKNKYEGYLKRNEMTLFEVEEEFSEHEDCIGLISRLMDLLTSWDKIYAAKTSPVNQLAVLAGDSQNVHTGPVNKQTRTSMEIMISTPVPKEQRTLDDILTVWVMDLKIGAAMSEVYKDMLYWANKSWVIQKGDYIYRRALRGLWAKINSYSGDTRLELANRLWEECNESVGMCAQGHLSRLANVLVGFDEAFKSPQSLKESLQDAMAHISTLMEPLEDKVAKAVKVMDELGLPHEERQAWLDAF